MTPAALTARVLLSPRDTSLSDLCCPVDRWTLACAIDEAFGCELTSAQIEAWETVGDVVDSARVMA